MVNIPSRSLPDLPAAINPALTDLLLLEQASGSRKLSGDGLVSFLQAYFARLSADNAFTGAGSFSGLVTGANIVATPEQFGAATDGDATDNRIALIAALNSGAIVDGRGKTYQISGSIRPSIACRLRNITLQQVLTTANITLDVDGISDALVENVTVIKSDTVTDMHNTIGIRARNSPRVKIIGCDVSGGANIGIKVMGSSDHARVLYNHVHDMAYAVPSVSAGQEFVQGIVVEGTEHTLVGFNSVRDFSGTIADVADRNHTRGITIGSPTYQATVVGNTIEHVNQGIDFTGSGENTGFTCVGNNIYDAWTMGIKCSNKTKRGTVTGNTVWKAGLYGYVFSGIEVEAIVCSSNIAINTGEGYTDPGAPFPFLVESSTEIGFPNNVKIIGCIAADFTGDPAPTAGFYGNLVDPDGAWPANELINCTTIGIDVHQVGFDKPRVAVYDTAFSCPNAAWTPVTFDTEVEDDLFGWDVGDPTLITVPIDGIYTISAYVNWTTSANGMRGVRFLVNDSQTLYDGGEVLDTAGGGGRTQNLAIVKELKKGQTVKLSLFQESGGALNVDARLQITRLGA